MKILFAAVDGGGNIPPQLAVARALRARGAEVRILGHEGVRERVQAAGFPFETFTTGTDFNPIAQRSLPSMMRDMTEVMTDRRLGRDVVSASQRHGADVAVVDVLLTAALPEIAAAQLPTAVFVHCFYRAIQDQAVGPVGWLLRLRGVAPLGAERSGALQIVTARADLDPCVAHRRSATSAWCGRASRPRRQHCRCPGFWSA
ncbi:glycosyltransferase [Mycobacterium sp.]|uniref:glycosyltransferase n=1 Tax=Mycobacterium sp. TaxID=1785 RepID=UPI003C777671